ncbi:proteasome accessory factor B [Actinoalloteichus hoggarensis]|uniref:helix-turn-helix transcriptional regulator n=1 Tax=Actinoalloteichus hoggarensis TaxID=1470176 RepID=UPI000B8B3357|nr:WYL domain-containing protein [Actinoalloteichus hoggarensis]MBB5919207.1 proteasome accessory factor B [Actinoalloteichus hoggarensis]
MSTARAERLVNLVLCLLSTRQFLNADRIRGIVPGYADAPTGDAFFRMFERDKAELRDLGIPLETGRNSGFDGTEGYRIARRDYELGEIDLEPDEAAAVALAARLWDSHDFADAARRAVVKLRAAGIDVDQGTAPAVEPRVRISEPSFAVLHAAVQAGRVVTFDHRRSSSPEPMRRVVEPWGVVSWRGRWYLVGHDRDRDATRCFRLSRIVGTVTPSGPEGAVTRPDGVDLLAIVAATAEPPPPAPPALLWIAKDRADGLRRHGRTVGERVVGGVDGDLLEIEFNHSGSVSDWIAGYGPDVLVVEPESLRESVREVLLGAMGEGER